MTTKIILLALVLLCGCEQWTARSFGGEVSIHLNNCEKLVNATWKETNLWFLVRPMKKDESPEAYTFWESSTLGVFQGKVTITEMCNR